MATSFISEQILKGLTLGLLIFFTFLFNAFVAFVLVFREKRLLSKPLYLFILNICVSDILASLFTLPFEVSEEIVHRWVYGEVACKIIEYVELSLFGVNIFTHLSIAVERFRNVVHALKPPMKLRTAKKLLLVTWCFPSFMAAPYLYMFRSREIDGNEICTAMSLPVLWLDKLFSSVEILAVFLIPLAGLSWIYFLIVRTLHRRQLLKCKVHGSSLRGTVRTKATHGSRLSIAVVCVFVICWLPFIAVHAVRLFKTTEYVSRNSKLYVTALYFSFANELLAPILYCGFDRNIRPALKRVLRCLPRRSIVQDSYQGQNGQGESGRIETFENRIEHETA